MSENNEILFLTVTAIIAICTYIVKNCKSSTCWSKTDCIKCNMNKSTSNSDISIDDETIKNEIKDKIIVSSVV